MLPDPQSITINTVAINFPRVKTGVDGSTYSTADGKMELAIFNQKTKGNRERHVVRFTQTKDVADAFTAGSPLKQQSYAISFTLDQPVVGFTDVEMRDAWVGIRTWLSTTIIDRLLANES